MNQFCYCWFNTIPYSTIGIQASLPLTDCILIYCRFVSVVSVVRMEVHKSSFLLSLLVGRLSKFLNHQPQLFKALCIQFAAGLPILDFGATCVRLSTLLAVHTLDQAAGVYEYPVNSSSDSTVPALPPQSFPYSQLFSLLIRQLACISRPPSRLPVFGTTVIRPPHHVLPPNPLQIRQIRHLRHRPPTSPLPAGWDLKAQIILQIPPQTPPDHRPNALL